jgi:cytidylate kinase
LFPNEKSGIFKSIYIISDALKNIIIAIDGPAASGKSSTAKRVAHELGYIHADTGAMYRAVALKALRLGIAPGDADAVAAMTKTTAVRLEHDNDERLRVMLDGEDVTDAIRLPDVTRTVSEVSAIPAVRELMVREQRAMGSSGGIVLEGRDIGTVVFPHAELKIFMIADPRERAVRRAKELEEKGIHADVQVLEQEIRERDAYDSSRAHSPLKKAEDAIVLDTTHLTIEEQTAYIVCRAKERSA